MSDKSGIGRVKVRWEENKQRLSLIFIFSLFIFGILVVAIVLGAGVALLIEFLQGEAVVIDTWLLFLIMAAVSAVMGFGLAMLLTSTVLIKPFNTVFNAMERLAGGDFNARIELKGSLKNISALREITASFNRMAEELGKTEMLRSDFVNNFSHEFKTPIVSIAGFAELLRSEDLTADEREHYLSIIGEESKRLASLTTNILNLTKIEHQSILTDVSEFNLSEQIRSAFLLLESKWAPRGIVPVLDFDEVSISANEPLLKEVWLNLVDNAIKFSPECSEIEVAITDSDGIVSVTVTNEGAEIGEEMREMIFHKFYQGDESHSGEGSGVGLALVKSVCELHGGDVSVESSGGRNSFTVRLPKA